MNREAKWVSVLVFTIAALGLVIPAWAGDDAAPAPACASADADAAPVPVSVPAADFPAYVKEGSVDMSIVAAGSCTPCVKDHMICFGNPKDFMKDLASCPMCEPITGTFQQAWWCACVPKAPGK